MSKIDNNSTEGLLKCIRQSEKASRGLMKDLVGLLDSTYYLTDAYLNSMVERYCLDREQLAQILVTLQGFAPQPIVGLMDFLPERDSQTDKEESYRLSEQLVLTQLMQTYESMIAQGQRWYRQGKKFMECKFLDDAVALAKQRLAELKSTSDRNCIDYQVLVQ